MSMREINVEEGRRVKRVEEGRRVKKGRRG